MSVRPEQLVSLLKVTELKDCLAQFGLARTGRKAELQQRILGYLNNLSGTAGAEQQRGGAEKVIKEMYARMRGVTPGRLGSTAPGHGEYVLNRAVIEQIDHAPAMQNASKAQDVQRRPPSSTSGKAGLLNGKSHASVNGRLAMSPAHRNTQIRCLCDINIDRGNMVQCEGDGCGVWQHCACVGVDAKVLPKHFFCETCTVQRADPFWRAISHHQIMPPARLLPSLHPGMPVASGSELGSQSVERIFMLNTSTLEPLRRSSEQQLQVACVLLGDEVPFRVHWPKQADLRINNMRMTVARRNITHALGANARDEPVNITSAAMSGRNRVTLGACDGRSFCLVMQHAARRTQSEVEGMMAPHETAEHGHARVRRRVAADSDDVEVSSTTVSLRCPMTGCRVGRAGRFQGIDALAAFDLDAFLSMAARTRKWQCPHTMRHTCVQQLHNDAFIQGILDRLKVMPDVLEVEVSPEGQWKPANSAYSWQDFSGPPLQPLAKVKAEPDAMKWRGQVLQNGRLPDSDTESDESEGAEMRKAAQAVKDAQAGKRPKPDVIVISDSDDEQDSRPAKRPATLQAHHIPSHLQQRPVPAGISHMGQVSQQQNGRLPVRNSSNSNSTSTSGHTSAPAHNSYGNGTANRGGPASTSARSQQPQLPKYGPQQHSSLTGAVTAEMRVQQLQTQQQQRLQQQQQQHPLRVRIPPRSARPAAPPSSSAPPPQQQQQQQPHSVGPSGAGPLQRGAFLRVPAASSGLRAQTPAGMHRLSSTTSASHSQSGAWHDQQAMLSSAFQAQSSPFHSPPVPMSLPTSAGHLQQQHQQHQDAWTTRPGWMDSRLSSTAQQSSATASPLWGEPPLPPAEPPSLPDLQPAASSDSQDWLGMLFDQGAPSSNGFETGLGAFGDNSTFPPTQSAGQSMAKSAPVIELSP